MSYISKKNKPKEYASKINHTHIIKDQEVVSFLQKCNLPKENQDIDIKPKDIINLQKIEKNPINYIITVDGGYTSVEPKKSFPSSEITFYQFGVHLLMLKDWHDLENKLFISPEHMGKYKDLDRIKLCLPTKQIIYNHEKSFKDSVRKAIYDFFIYKHDKKSNLMEVLCWLIFQDYALDTQNKEGYKLINPNTNKREEIQLKKEDMKEDYTFETNSGKVYLTDIIRIHEGVDEELGAGSIVGILATTIEQILLAKCIKEIYESNPNLLKEIMFIKDGSLAFFGVTARLHTDMRKMINFMQKNYALYMAGVEKTGIFADHADELNKPSKENKNKLIIGKALLLSNDYIYTNILPRRAKETYGSTSYYSAKVIYKADELNVYVVNIPVKDNQVIEKPRRENYKHLDEILYNIKLFKCNIYQNALIPVAMVNQLISLANRPSQTLLQKFAKKALKTNSIKE